MKKTVLMVLALVGIANSLFALEPKREHEYTPEDFGMEFEEIQITVEPEKHVNAWYFKANKTSYKIIILSDDGEGNMTDMMEIASQFLGLGFHVVTYDYRGYGKSSDLKIVPKFAIYPQFEQDLRAVYNHVKNEMKAIPQVYFYGKGIGASLSICMGLQVKGVGTIADSPYYTLADYKDKQKEHNGKDVMLPLGFDKSKLEPAVAISKTKGVGGILYITGDADKTLDSKYVKGTILKNSNDKSDWYQVKGADYAETFSANQDEYFNQIKEFLK